jgi:Protein of unknown function (DUF4239)
MSAFTTATIIAGCSFGTGLIGMLLRSKLPATHLDSDSKDVVKLVMGLVATMAALVLSLLIASASGSHQAQQSELQSLSANVILLDRLLDFYGPDAKEPRDVLRGAVAHMHNRIWSTQASEHVRLDPRASQDATAAVVQRLQSLQPDTRGQRILQRQAMQVAQSLAQTRLLMFEQSSSSISWPFLTVLVFWICMLFLGFGLFASFNGTVTVALFIGAVSVDGAVFLILELSQPYEGFMRVRDAPLLDALDQIGQ